MGYYRNVITKFPDSYYAYRAYLKINRLTGPLITSYINPQPVVYPYKYTKNNIIVKLVDLQDYDIISELVNDEFIKSWVLYKKVITLIQCLLQEMLWIKLHKSLTSMI